VIKKTTAMHFQAKSALESSREQENEANNGKNVFTKRKQKPFSPDYSVRYHCFWAFDPKTAWQYMVSRLSKVGWHEVPRWQQETDESWA